MLLSHEAHPAYRETALPPFRPQQPRGCPGPYPSWPWPAGQPLDTLLLRKRGPGRVDLPANLVGK